MSEHGDEFFEDDTGNRSQQGEPSVPVNNPNENTGNRDRDLVDTFKLFTTYLDTKLSDLKTDIISEQESISLKVKEDVNLKFKSEGNKIQYRFNEDILANLGKLRKHCPSATAASTFTEISDKLKARNKLIRIADTSAGGWATVREYEQNEIADNSDDEKRIRQAEGRALRTSKEKERRRPAPYAVKHQTAARQIETPPNSTSSLIYGNRRNQPFRGGAARREPSAWDVCFFCKNYGHWRKNCPYTTTGSQPTGN